MPLFKNRIHNTEPLMYIRIPINTHSPNRFFSIISLYYASLRIFNVIHHRSSQRLYWYVLAYVSVTLMFYYFWHTSFIKNNTRFSKCFSFHQHISQRFFIDRRSTRNIYIAIESFYICYFIKKMNMLWLRRFIKQRFNLPIINRICFCISSYILYLLAELI